MTNIQLKKIQAAKEAQATKAQASKVNGDNDGITVNTKPVTNADMVEAAMLHILNSKLIEQGKPTYKSYSDYINPPKNYVVNQEEKNIDPVTPLNKIEAEALDFGGQPLKAKGEVYHIVSGGYYIGFNKSRCYIQKDDSNEVNILLHGNKNYGDSSVMAMIPNKSFRDVTKAELDSIVKGKPAYKDVFQAYSKCKNFQNVVLDTTNATSIW